MVLYGATNTTILLSKVEPEGKITLVVVSAIQSVKAFQKKD